MYLSVYLSIYLSIYLSFYVYLSIFLSIGWQPSDGGALRLFPKNTGEGAAGGNNVAVDILPVAGTVQFTIRDGEVAMLHVKAYQFNTHNACDNAYIGRLALFYSADIAHEVLPTFGDRHALTIWSVKKALQTLKLHRTCDNRCP